MTAEPTLMQSIVVRKATWIIVKATERIGLRVIRNNPAWGFANTSFKAFGANLIPSNFRENFEFQDAAPFHNWPVSTGQEYRANWELSAFTALAQTFASDAHGE